MNTSRVFRILLVALIGAHSSICAAADISDDAFLGFDYVQRVGTAIEIIAIHPGKQAASVGLAIGDKIVGIKAASMPALDQEESAGRQRGVPYPSTSEMLEYLDRANRSASELLAIIVERNGVRKEVQFKLTSHAIRTCAFNRAECPSWIRLAEAERKASEPQAPANAAPRSTDTRPDRPPTALNRNATTLVGQQAQCDQGNASACVKLDQYRTLERSCHEHNQSAACDLALAYSFADRDALIRDRHATVQEPRSGKADTTTTPQSTESALVRPPTIAIRPANTVTAVTPPPMQPTVRGTNAGGSSNNLPFLLALNAVLFVASGIVALVLQNRLDSGTTMLIVTAYASRFPSFAAPSPIGLARLLGTVLVVALAVWLIISLSMLALICLLIAGAGTLYTFIKPNTSSA